MKVFGIEVTIVLFLVNDIIIEEFGDTIKLQSILFIEANGRPIGRQHMQIQGSAGGERQDHFLNALFDQGRCQTVLSIFQNGSQCHDIACRSCGGCGCG